MVEEFLRGRRPRQFASAMERALEIAKRHPIPAVAIAAGAGWLIFAMGRERARGLRHRRMEEAEEIPILNTGHARIYDPDASPLHPTQDSLESRREMSARI